MRGRVLEVLADLARVVDGAGQVHLCQFRGRLRRDVDQVLAGDWVELVPAQPMAMVERVLPRQNRLVRPPLANAEGLLTVFSPVEPRGSLALLDRRLVTAELMGLAAAIVVTKADLWADDPSVWARLAPWRAIYPTVAVSVAHDDGWERIPPMLGTGVWVMTGESGVGKTSLLRRLLPDPAGAGAVGALSGRTGRGRHTTRTVALAPVGAAWLADTPGFTQLELPPHDAVSLRDAFPEWRGARCRYGNCRHLGEPGCVVPAWVASGQVSRERYEHYRLLQAEPDPSRHRPRL